MSLHKSLKTRDELARRRNVLKLAERLSAMKELGTWKEGDKVHGFPKLRSSFTQKKRKKKEAPVDKAAEGDEAPDTAAEDAEKSRS